MRVDRPSLPLEALAAAASLAVDQRGPLPLPSELACAPRLQLSIIQLAASPDLLLDGYALCRQHLQPRLAAQPLLPPANLSTAALLHPPPLPSPLLRRLQAAARPLLSRDSQEAQARQQAAAHPALLRHASQLLQLAQDTHHIPPPTSEHASATVLVHVAAVTAEAAADGGPDMGHDVEGGDSGSSSDAAGGLGSKGQAPTMTGVGLGEEALALFVVQPGMPSEQLSPEVQLAVQQQVAATIADWLAASMQPAARAAEAEGASLGTLERPGSTGHGQAGAGAQGAAELAAACLTGAGAMLGQFLAALRALPDMHVAPELSHLAARAAHEAAEAQHAQQQVGHAPAAALRLARAAWGSAWRVQHHPGFGTDAVFPAEHQLAVILPLALPVALVVLRLLVQEFKDWRHGRRAVAGEAAVAAAGGPAGPSSKKGD
jgi:hypothetical protein